MFMFIILACRCNSKNADIQRKLFSCFLPSTWSAVAQVLNAGLAIERARVRILPWLPFRSLAIFVLSTTPQFTKMYKLEPSFDLAIYCGGNMSESSFPVVAAWLYIQEKSRGCRSERVSQAGGKL